MALAELRTVPRQMRPQFPWAAVRTTLTAPSCGPDGSSCDRCALADRALRRAGPAPRRRTAAGGRARILVRDRLPALVGHARLHKQVAGLIETGRVTAWTGTGEDLAEALLNDRSPSPCRCGSRSSAGTASTGSSGRSAESAAGGSTPVGRGQPFLPPTFPMVELSGHAGAIQRRLPLFVAATAGPGVVGLDPAPGHSLVQMRGEVGRRPTSCRGAPPADGSIRGHAPEPAPCSSGSRGPCERFGSPCPG
jgi:hypothetical protein